MDSLFTFIKKNPFPTLVIVLLIPIGVGLIYGALKSFWVSRRNKKEAVTLYQFLVDSQAYDRAFTNEEISKATGIPKDRVIGHCADHPGIEDAGKRQRSWKLARKDSA